MDKKSIRDINSPDDLQPALNDLRGSLEEYLDEKIAPLKKTVDATVKGFDQFQAKAKNEGRFAPNAGSTMDVAGLIAQGLKENTENLTRLANGETKGFSFETKTVGDINFTSNYSGGTIFTTSNGIPGVQNMAPRIIHIRDLLNKTQMTGSTLPILLDNGGEGAFASTSEGALKPQLDFDLLESTVKAEVIAGFVVITKQFQEDIPNASNWLVQKLTDAYMTVEDSMILSGTGVSPQIKGLNIAGNFTAATALAAENDVAQLVKGIIQLRTLGRVPTGIIIHPSNFENLLLNQATGSGEFDLPTYITVTNGGDISILGVPVVSTIAQTAGVYNIIDNRGMSMAIRENLKVEFFPQDASNVRYNKITVRAESRFALPVIASTYNIKGAFA